MNTQEKIWKEWLAEVVLRKPKNNKILESSRGIQLTKLALKIEHEDVNWHRSDIDTFWIDIQMAVKYKLTDREFKFICKQQPGIDNYARHSDERRAYNEFKRGLDKLRLLFGELEKKDGKLVEVNERT